MTRTSRVLSFVVIILPLMALAGLVSTFALEGNLREDLGINWPKLDIWSLSTLFWVGWYFVWYLVARPEPKTLRKENDQEANGWGPRVPYDDN